MKLAVVHDRLVDRGVRERVAASMYRLYPDAAVYAGALDRSSTVESLRDVRVEVSARPPRIGAVDAVVACGTSYAHRARTGAGACRVAYVLDDAEGEPTNPFRRLAVRIGRNRAHRGIDAAHVLLAASRSAAKAVKAYTDRDAHVIHPPVDIEAFRIAPTTRNVYALVGPLDHGRRADVVIRTFSALGRRLLVIGDGPARPALEALAGPSVGFLGSVEDERLADVYSVCRGVIVMSGEGYPLAAVEANAAGRPAIAVRGADTEDAVVHGVTGVLFEPATPGALTAAIEEAERHVFDPVVVRAHAETFAEPRFHERLRHLIERSVRSCLTCARARRRASRTEPLFLPVEKPATAARRRSGAASRIVP